MQLTKNFRITEFEKGQSVPDQYFNNVRELAIQLQKARDILGLPFLITSGYRDPEHNASVGGARNSYHLKASAADLKIQGLTGKQMFWIFSVLMDNGIIKNGGLKEYDNRIHYDIRQGKWREGTKVPFFIHLLLTLLIKAKTW